MNPIDCLFVVSVERVSDLNESIEVLAANGRHLQLERDNIQMHLDTLIKENQNLPESKAFLRKKMELLHQMNSKEYWRDQNSNRKFQLEQSRDALQQRIELLNAHRLIARHTDPFVPMTNMDDVAESFVRLDVHTEEMQRDHSRMQIGKDSFADAGSRSLLEAQLREYETNLMIQSTTKTMQSMYDPSSESSTETQQTAEGELDILHVRQLVYS